MTVHDELLALAEPEYRRFASSLIPGCRNLIGVRIPALRKIAVRIARENPLEFLEKAEESLFEETMLKGLVIGRMDAGIDVVLEQTARHIPKITNWSLCDNFCCELKIVSRHKEQVWNFLKPYSRSDKAFEIRTAVVMYLLYFIDGEHLDRLFQTFDSITNDNYYVKMSVAWAISMCFVKYPDAATAYLNRCDLDDETYNRALRKIRESLRVDAKTKRMVKSMMRK